MTVTASSELEQLGWDAFFADAWEPYGRDGLVAGRVAVQHRGAYDVLTADGPVWAEPRGRLTHEAASGGLPAVGDWIALRPLEQGHGLVEAVLPRKSKFSRKEAFHSLQEQVLAANVDTVFLVMAFDLDFSLHRLERYLTLAWESGASPVVVLTKADLAPDVEDKMTAVGGVAIGVPVHAISNVTGQGLGELDQYLVPGRTIAALGSSGVGKSTLINRLVGEERFATQTVADDGTGRHTTTRRELVRLPNGALIIDTPGMRELQLWDSREGLDEAFDDLTSLFEQCRFNDCAHETEPGCAVRAAIAEGRLDADRLESYRKLTRELEALERKLDKRLSADERKEIRRQARMRRNPKLY